MSKKKFKVGDEVRTLVDRDLNGIMRFPTNSIGYIIGISEDTNAVLPICISTTNVLGRRCWYSEYELELVEPVVDVDGAVRKIDICSDVARDVTVELTVKQVEKLEEELRRKDSELRDLKGLIIKLLFDRYGYV